jgi:hypothetical protein
MKAAFLGLKTKAIIYAYQCYMAVGVSQVRVGTSTVLKD